MTRIGNRNNDQNKIISDTLGVGTKVAPSWLVIREKQCHSFSQNQLQKGTLASGCAEMVIPLIK